MSKKKIRKALKKVVKVAAIVGVATFAGAKIAPLAKKAFSKSRAAKGGAVDSIYNPQRSPGAQAEANQPAQNEYQTDNDYSHPIRAIYGGRLKSGVGGAAVGASGAVSACGAAGDGSLTTFIVLAIVGAALGIMSCARAKRDES